MPEGVAISFGGEYELGVDEVTPMYYALAMTIAIIFIILLFQFRNVKTAVLIMMTMPLSIFGAALGVKITGYAFSVTALIGVISLMGIVVRNGIIYISYAEELRREHGHSLVDAAMSAAKRRMRPIFLTLSRGRGGRGADDTERVAVMGSIGFSYLLRPDFRHDVVVAGDSGALFSFP